MITLVYQQWSPWNGVIVFAILVGICIAIIVTIDLMIPEQTGQDPEPLEPAPNADLFSKVEEYRNDFPEFNGTRSPAGLEQLPRDFDCCRRVGNCGHGRPYREGVLPGS